jgi:predicted PurR-regulated permease PerM
MENSNTLCKFILSVIFFLIIAAAIYSLGSIFLPFIIAAIFSYLLNPLVKKLKALKLSRNMATVLTLTIFFTALLLSLMLILPIIVQQTGKLLDLLKLYTSGINKEQVLEVLHRFQSISPSVIDKLQEGINDISIYLIDFTSYMLKSIFHSGMVAVNVLSLALITPILTYYLLRDWEKVTKGIYNLIPMRNRKDAGSLLSQFDLVLSGYLRGQIYVYLILAAYYMAAFAFLGLESGIALGFVTGFLTFIPYVGPIFGSLLAVLIAMLQFKDISYAGIVLAIFVFGQLVEGNFITPNLVGDKVGLHPLWIMFGLLAGGVLMGILGILIAVPLTAVVGVVIKFSINKYLNSLFYKTQEFNL